MENRAVWGRSIEFLMSCIATSVGLGNIWRFPFIAYENGGGAFLIPYIIVLFLIGKPLYYLEMIIGQFTSRSVVKAYDFCPALRGVAVGQLFGTFCISTYYSSLIALTFYYMIASFSSELPWSTCWDGWIDCVDSKPNAATNVTTIGRATSSAELFYLKIVLKHTDDISGGIGIPDWKLVILLFISYIVVYLVLVRGVRSSGKASYFLALFPYIIMLILFFRAVTLEGAGNGILFFITPKWSELLNAKVWKEAITQLFFSLSVGVGPIITYSSYNRFDHNIYRDALIVTSLDTLTSLLSGFTIFGILGNLAHNLNLENIDEVVKSGTGLAFISYPDAMSKFDVVPQLFSVLFFFMLFVLGIGSMVSMECAILTTFCDRFQKWKFWQAALILSLFGFGISLIYITPGGQWMLNLVDHYGATFIIFLLAIFELVAIFWIYGLENLCLDLEFMSGRKASFYWRFCWFLVTPIFMIVVFIQSMVEYEELQYSDLDYPDIALVCGWLLFTLGISQVFLWAFGAYLQRTKGSKLERLVDIFKPNDRWGPADSENKSKWIRFKAEALEKKNKAIIIQNHPWWQQKLYVFLGKYR